MTQRPERSTWFRKAAKQFKNEGQTNDAPCWICGKPIDYNAQRGHPQSHTLDHLHPVSTNPELHDDTANWRHAHHSCNAARGNRKITQTCSTLPNWWSETKRDSEGG